MRQDISHKNQPSDSAYRGYVVFICLTQDQSRFTSYDCPTEHSFFVVDNIVTT